MLLHAPEFRSRREAIQWAVNVGAYRDYTQAEVVYLALFEQIRPDTAPAMFVPWVARVSGRVKQQMAIYAARKRHRALQPKVVSS